MSQPIILLIDDEVFPDQSEGERGYMWYYSTAMRDNGMEVIEALDTDKALQLLDERGDAISLVVLDIMMPPGHALKDVDTMEGLRSGIPLALLIARKCPELPIVVLTNVRNQALLAPLKKMRQVKRILFKEDWPPFSLVRVLKQIGV